MEGEKSWIFRSCDRTRGDKDRGRKDKRYSGLADTKVYQEYLEVLRIGKLLLLIYPELHIYS